MHGMCCFKVLLGGSEEFNRESIIAQIFCELFPLDIFPAFAHARRILHYFTNPWPSVGHVMSVF